MSYTRDNGNVQNFTQILLGASSVRPTDNLPELTSGSARVLSSVDTDLSSESERGVEAMCVAERVGWRSVTKAAPRMTCMAFQRDCPHHHYGSVFPRLLVGLAPPEGGPL
eukprot:CAMPEP_0167773058 /NCGR_PEP_ID=MMETSP0111_2-20121227/1205_1 /TAXON_ID=91324 /ORGANISM="Lotharella globosa, Strain CCCM811" /LENGTH=109 /DNA_ID=CAMNT_0007662645 /DNA_START=196 /DNA_END=526 /DNA_ORIENTATION=+